MPYLEVRGGTLDRLGIRIEGAPVVGGKARIGIYTSTSSTNLYPNSLVVDSGEVDVSAIGVKTVVISQSLSAGLYWFVYVHNTGSVQLCGSVSTDDTSPYILGVASDLDPTTGNPRNVLRVSFAFAALPATFPAGASLLRATFPYVFARYSG